MNKIRKQIGAIASAILSVAATDSLSAEFVRYRAQAFDLTSGRLLYTEYHTETRADGRHVQSIVVYRRADGTVIARKRINYRKSKISPDYIFRDLRTGYMEELTASGNVARMRARRSSSDEVQARSVSLPPPTVVDAGFDNFVRLKWDRLLTGTPLLTNFAVPIELDYYRFKIWKLGNVQAAGKQAVRFRFAPANPVLALIAGHIDVDYDRTTRKLLVYRGISNINDDNGKSYKARIVFTYPEDLAVTPSDERAVRRSARSAKAPL